MQTPRSTKSATTHFFYPSLSNYNRGRFRILLRRVDEGNFLRIGHTPEKNSDDE